MYRVLYVDDEPDLLNIGKMFLERSGEFAVTTALSAPEGIRLLEQEKFDAIISDYQMPGMDGIQFLVEVRTRFGPIPFILFTGRGREEVVIQAINNGVDFYIQKGGEPGSQFAELSHKVKSAALRKKAEIALGENERVHATMISNLPGFVYRCANDSNWTMEFISDGCREITGYSPDDLLGNKLLTYNDLVHPDFQKRLWDNVQNSLEKREVFEEEYPLITKTQETRWVWERGRGIYSDDGRLLFLEGFITDITERKRADGDIRTAVETYRNIFLNSQIGLFRTDVHTGLLLDVNDTVARFIGYPDRASLLAKPFNIVERYADAYDHEKIVSLLKADGEFRNYEARFVKNDGSIIWMRFSGKLVKEKGWIEGVSEDITERKRAEEALGESESFNRNLVENLPDYIGISAPDGKILYMNASAMNALGFTMEEIIGTSVLSHVAEECRGDVISKMASRPGGGEVPPYEIDVLSKDRRRISVIVKGTPIRYHNSPALLLVLTDITGRKRAEETLHESEEKYRSLVSNIPGIVYRCANDPDWTMLYISQEIDPISDYPASDFINNAVRSYASIIHPDDRDLVDRAVQKGVKEKSTYVMEYRICRADGSIRWVQELGQGVFAPNGDLLWLDGVILDQTGRKLAEDALRESDERYRAIYDQSPIAIELYDGKGKLVHVNPACLKLFGIESMQEIQNFSLFADPNVNDEQKERLHKGETVQYSGPFDFEKVKSLNLYTTSREGIIWLDVLITPLGNRADSITGFLVQIQDITGRKQMENAHRESEEKFRLITETIDEAFWMADVEIGKIFYVSPSFERIWGFSKESLYKNPRSFLDAVHKDDRERVLADLEIEKTGLPFDHEYRIVLPDGNIRNIWDRGFPIRDEKGQISIYAGIAMDITERKRAEEALAENEQRFNLALEGTGAGLWDWDMVNDRVVYSTQWKRMLGYEDHEVENSFSGWKNLWHPDDCTKIEETLADYLAGKTSRYEIIHRLCHKDGDWRWIVTRGEIIKDAEGKPVRWVGTNIDISERKLAEEVLQRQTTTLAILNEIISTANKADDLPQLLESILSESLRLLDFDAGGIYMVDRSTRTANVVHSKNLPKEFLAEIQTAPIDKKPYDTMFIKNEPIFTENYAQIASDRSKKYGFQSMASIPLLSKGVAIGALNLASTRKYVISDEEKQTLFSISRELGSTIERMAAEEKAKNASKNLETLFNSIDEMVFVLDMQGHILVVNNTVSKRLSYTPEELTGTDVLLLHVPERRDEALRNVQGMIAGTIDSCPVPVLAKDGTRIEVETKVTRGFWNGNEVLIGVSRDITERKRVEEALRESEETFRIHIENSFDVIFTLNRDGEFVFVSPAWERHFGYPVSNVIGKSFAPFVHPDDIAPLVEYLKRVLITGQSEASPAYRVRHADGRWFWLIANGTPIVNAKGEQQFVGVGRDITERKLAEEAFKEHDEKIRLLLDSTAEAIYGLDMNGNCTFCNNSCLRLLGYKHPRELLGRNMHWQIHHKHPDGTHFPVEECRIFQAFNIGKGTHVDDEVLWRSDGTSFPAEYWSYPQRRDGVVVGAVVTFIDITERKLAEEALRLSEQKLSSILNDIADVVWSLSWPDMNVHYISPSVEKVYGRSLQEFIDKPSLWAEITHPDDKQISNNALEQLRKAGSAERECRIVRPDGSIVWIHDKSKIIFDKNDTPIRVDGITSDITERKELEKEMEYHALELRQFSTSLAAANKKLTLLSSITRHDINNQLTVLMGFLTILKKKQPDPTLTEYFVKVSNAAQRIAAMIQFTSEYEKIGVSTPVWQDVRTVLGTAAKQAPLGKIIVKNDLPTGQEVFADPLVVKVFYNLMDNAVRYGGKITTIRFSVEEAGEDHLIVCEDDGDGVDAEEKKKIFERGFGKNTGLGLALSREILSITGITIKETGEPGTGARFEMTVPKGAWK